jgi:hypothetical protein
MGSKYQITITLPNGKWRVRRQTAAEVNDIARHILQSIGDKIHLDNLQQLWPSEALAKWHRFGDDVFDAVCSGVARMLEAGRLTVLKTGQDLLKYATDFLKSRGWEELAWSDIAKHLLKVLLSAVIGWLRVQFPAINASNAGQAVKLLAGLAARRG